MQITHTNIYELFFKEIKKKKTNLNSRIDSKRDFQARECGL